MTASHTFPLTSPNLLQPYINNCFQAIISMQKDRKLANLAPIDTLVSCGISGNIITGILCYVMNLNQVIVRKLDDKCYSNCTYEGTIVHANYLIIDDLISTGKTLIHILDTISYLYPSVLSNCIGVLLWQTGHDFKQYINKFMHSRSTFRRPFSGPINDVLIFGVDK